MAELDERGLVARLHDRFGFGPRAGDLEVGVTATLDRLLGDGGADGPEPPKPGAPVKAGDDKQARKEANKRRAADERQLVLWWLDRMVAADVATTERLTWFWHGHFATSEQKVRDPRLMLAQNATLRRQALGPFAPLARAMVVDPAMIRWLDGDDNRSGVPNENLAREFLELFALGIGHYTETDVREAARALTGWTVDRDAGTARFVAKRHDDGVKEIFGAKDDFTAESFVDLVLARPESAAFVVDRLWFRLVSTTPPPDDARRRLVAALSTDVRSVLRAIAAEPVFRDRATTLVKQPVEWLVGLMRALDVRPSKLPERAVTALGNGLRGLGQLPFRPPSVGGWPADAAWLTTAAGVTRLRVARLVAAHADLPRDVDGVGRLLGVAEWSDRTRAALGRVSDPDEVAALAACAPEYVVSA
ncbi:DUF1800 domain-containing protein [Saccharothrix violaceirubra]|uniref:Uncharacterized protein (DUF1800 family) n=1 Tax=Saccharothrix violaceirubra TaxID=413306 RepID=A0A7W7T3W2_9PSEU|nr:DUF1800 domain-containing protein [Saccharothrix violaceirubra]MBB4966100.1 uncharacterized protein (DUF1800 family) [Saccharothrix violaceirubra]